MKGEAEFRELVAVLYGEIGGDAAAPLRITPLYGSWYTALKYEIKNAHGTSTAVWRRDIEDQNCEALRDALRPLLSAPK